MGPFPLFVIANASFMIHPFVWGARALPPLDRMYMASYVLSSGNGSEKGKNRKMGGMPHLGAHRVMRLALYQDINTLEILRVNRYGMYSNPGGKKTPGVVCCVIVL